MPVYLDHAATTPLHPAVRAVMEPFAEEVFGNASSLHGWGRAARAAVEDARDQVASALGVAPLDVIFTAGGTEADNLAIKGIARAARDEGRGSHIVTTAIEHHAVLEAVESLVAHERFTATIVAVNGEGLVEPDELLAAVRPDTALVSVMAANNEIGTVQPLDRIGPALAARKVVLHTDAVQAFGRSPVPMNEWQIGALSLSAHKFNGPKGVGVLVLRRDIPCRSVLDGGGQERGVRSGTLNTAGIVGCGAAAELTHLTSAVEVPRLRALRDRLTEGLLGYGGVTVNGSMAARLPHNLHIGVEGCNGEALLLALDAGGVAVSTGSACQSGAAEPSHVLEAIGAPMDRAHLRFTCGRTTTEAEIDEAVAVFQDCVRALRGARTASRAAQVPKVVAAQREDPQG